MHPTPERGFEYFPSPESDDDSERIAYAFLYCAEAVKQWPRFRRRLIKAGLKTAEQCDHIEAHTINVFKETRDTMLLAIETDNIPLMSEPRLLERWMHAHALLALFANPGSMPGYRDMILGLCGGGSPGEPKLADFENALWEAEWHTSGSRMPAQVTRAQATGHRRLREGDGLYNSRRRRDHAANASELNENTQGPALLPKEQSKVIEEEIKGLIPQIRAVARRAGLKPAQIKFLVDMVLHGKQQKDNPTAWRVIRGRKRAILFAEIKPLIARVQELRENSICQ